jgi:hypothetical protein
VIEVARLLLAAVLAVAGAAKLADRDGSRRATEAFGVPRPAAGAIAVLVPASELVLAAALVPARTAQGAAAAAAVLFLGFAAAVGRRLTRGERPECHCFGVLHSAPIGVSTLARASGLAAVAAVVAGQPARPVSPSQLAAAAVVALVAGQAVLVLALLRRLGTALRRIDELESSLDVPPADLGSVAFPFSLTGPDGASRTLASLTAAGLPVLLVFTETGCGACTALLPDVGRWQREAADRITVAIVGHGDEARLLAEAEEHGLEHLLLAPDRSTAFAYGIEGTPAAVLVAEGLIASPVLYGAGEIATLFEPGPTTVERVLSHA